MSALMMDCWAAFARTGSPATTVGTGTGSWPAFTDAAPATMVFGQGERAEAVLTDALLRGEELLSAWAGIGEVQDLAAAAEAAKGARL